MTHIALTGAGGFLGWHTQVAAIEESISAKAIPLGGHFNPDWATKAVSGATRLVHLAGINRGTDDEVRSGNTLFARQAADALRQSEFPPLVVAFANSTQSTNGSVYGDAKAEAAEMLRSAATEVGASFEDVLLPNIFGEHGRPFYNAVTSTFCHLLAQGESPSVDGDKELVLLHAQDASDRLLGTISAKDASTLEVTESVSGLLIKLTDIARVYDRGEIADTSNPFQRNLFNTYRSYTAPGRIPVKLTRHADDRGSFFEIVRSHGGTGQSSFSTTNPGITRGDHFHRRKVERFTVLAGSATIALRRMLTQEVMEFHVTGDMPVAVDMPTMWSHNITNTGTDLLYTSFWTNDIFDPDEPDTIPEAVYGE